MAAKRHGAVRHEHHDERTDEERLLETSMPMLWFSVWPMVSNVVRDETQHVAEGVLL